MFKKNPSFMSALLLVVILAIIGLVVSLVAVKVKAAGVGDIDDVELHIKYEVSSDNGATWRNFSGTESSGGESITVTPGATVEIKVTTWNSDSLAAINVIGTGTTTNSSYIQNATILSDDTDADTIPYTGFFVSGGGAGGISLVPGLTPESPGETFTASLQLGSNFPAGQTVIESEIEIDDYTPELIVYRPFQLIKKAYALGVGNKSAIRIIVNNEQTGLPQTGPS